MTPYERMMEDLLGARIKIAALKMRMERISPDQTDVYGYDRTPMQRIDGMQLELTAIERALVAAEMSRIEREDK